MSKKPEQGIAKLLEQREPALHEYSEQTGTAVFTEGSSLASRMSTCPPYTKL